MRKGTAAILLGVTCGLIGVIAYSRFRRRKVFEDAESVIDSLAFRLRMLEASL